MVHPLRRLIHIEHFFAHGQAFRGFVVFQVPDCHFQEIGNCNSLGALVQALPALDALGGISLFSPVKDPAAADGVHEFGFGFIFEQMELVQHFKDR